MKKLLVVFGVVFFISTMSRAMDYEQQQQLIIAHNDTVSWQQFKISKEVSPYPMEVKDKKGQLIYDENSTLSTVFLQIQDAACCKNIAISPRIIKYLSNIEYQQEAFFLCRLAYFPNDFRGEYVELLKKIRSS